MRPIIKVFFFSLVVFLVSFLPALAGLPDSNFDLKRLKGENEDLIKWFDSTVGGQRTADGGRLSPGDPFSSTMASSVNVSEQKAIDAVINDFLVNDDTAGGCEQYYPAIARAPSGNFVITWGDERNGGGSSLCDIYTQRYDPTGIPIGFNLKVNDVAGSAASSWFPDIAMDGSGNFVITWQDYRNGNYDIYAQRYNSSGTPLGSNFKVNDDAGTISQYYPKIAMDSSGNFVVAWQDSRNGNSDIYAQRCNSIGTPQGSNFRVNDDTVISSQQYPAIATGGSGRFVVTWEDWRNDNPSDSADMYAQIYNSAGSPLGANFKVNDASGFADGGSPPGVAMDAAGDFVVVWEDDRNGNHDIFAQRYDSAGGVWGSNFKVNDDTVSAVQYSPPAIVMDGAGNFVITWEDHRNGDWDIYAQRYNSTGTPLDSNFKVNDDGGDADQWYPNIAMDGFGNFIIAWQDYRNGNYDIYTRRYNSTGTSQGSNFKVNDDIGSSDQWHQDIAIDGSGNFVIAWEDERNWNGDIYIQRYNSSGTRLGSNVKVNDDTESHYQLFPVIAMDHLSNFVVTWEDNRNGNYDIYAQKYDPSGTPLGSNFKVNDDSGSTWQEEPAIKIDGSGNFVITWCDRRNGNLDIYAQRYDSSGTPIGSNFKVNDDFGSASQLHPAIGMDGSGNFVITWQDHRNNNSDVYMQRYNASCVALGTNLKVNDDTITASQWYPTISMDGSGNFVITWMDYRNGNFDIYAQRYNSSGITLNSNFKVNDDAGTTFQYYPAIATDDSGKFVITWEDYRNGNADIYAQRYESSGNPKGNNYFVPNSQYASFAQQYPAVVANGSNIYFTWTDNRRAKGWDIYTKVVDWNWSKVEDDHEVILPISFELCQNYPNPFNPITIIKFTVHSAQSMVHRPVPTTLRIYNILGQKVRTLVDEPKSVGNYEVIWDGKDDNGKEVASGIYFYQLKAGEFSECKKMLFLK
jgi:hypothetical protein